MTDDASGTLTVIGLYNGRLISRVLVGSGAHHLTFTPDEHQVWVALSQAARAITLLSTVTQADTVDVGHPYVIGHFNPGFLAHDLRFSPDGSRVWITSADTSYVGVFSAGTHRLLFRVPAGAPPQHLVFDGGYAYITSGYGSRIEEVALGSGRVVRRALAPYGSFDLDAASGYVVTASLLRRHAGRLRPGAAPPAGTSGRALDRGCGAIGDLKTCQRWQSALLHRRPRTRVSSQWFRKAPRESRRSRSATKSACRS